MEVAGIWAFSDKAEHSSIHVTRHETTSQRFLTEVGGFCAYLMPVLRVEEGAKSIKAWSFGGFERSNNLSDFRVSQRCIKGNSSGVGGVSLASILVSGGERYVSGKQLGKVDLNVGGDLGGSVMLFLSD